MVQLEIRNPDDLTTTYNQIEIQRGLVSDGSDMAALATQAINSTRRSDLSMGYTSYVDATGVVGTHYYRFRYSNSGSSLVTSWSEIYLAGQTVFHNRFRRRMRDLNASNYYFAADDITDYLQGSVNKLWPHTWMETNDESLVLDPLTQKYNFPLGVTRVNDIDYIDSVGNIVGSAKGWAVRSGQVVFAYQPRLTYTMRLYVEKKFTRIGEVPEIFDDLILDLMRLQAYETLQADRARFYKYTTTVSPEGGNMPSISTIIADLKATTRDRLNQLRRVRRAVTYSYQ